MIRKISLAMLLLLFASLSAHAESIVRIQCEDEDFGTEVFINDKFVGECPIDAVVPAGVAVLRARKIMTNEDFEKVFEKKLRLGEGSAQRVELIMSAPQLTGKAKARQEAAEASDILKIARAGDITAMEEIAKRYDIGGGVKKDPAAAAMWRNKAEVARAQREVAAANAGDIEAMRSVAERYDRGLGVEKDLAQGRLWHEKAAAALRLKAEQEEETRRREQVAQEASDAKARAEEKERNDQRSSLVPNTRHLFKMITDEENSPGGWMSTATFGLPMTALHLVSDVTDGPTRSSELSKRSGQAALRPSTWGKPGSMIAKASRQYKVMNQTEDRQQIAGLY